MNKLIFNEIVEILNQTIKPHNFEYIHSYLDEETKKQLGTIEQVHQFGGEGQGDNYEVVNYFKDHDVYISLWGYYTSHEGVDYSESDYTEVRPKEKTIIVYE